MPLRMWRSLAKRARMVDAKAMLKSSDGATAVEFGLVAAPFVALLVALLETMLVFFAGRILDVAVFQASRQILTGQAQKSNMSQAGFAAAVCNSVYALFTCNKLMINVQTYASFGTAGTGTPTLTFDAQGNVTNSFQWNPGGPNDIVVVQVLYQWPIILGPLGFNLSNLSNGNRLMASTSVFKNEPYQ